MHDLFCSLFRDTFSGTHTYRSQIFVTKERDSLLNPLSHIIGNGSMGGGGWWKYASTKAVSHNRF
jgi:hypothetical protein